MKKHRIVAARAVAYVCLLLGMSLAAVPADAAAPPGPVIVEPAPSGIVGLDKNPDGTFSWRVSLARSGSYIASWERSAGIWQSAAEAKAALAQITKCQQSVKKAWLKKWNSFAQLKAHDESTLPDRWQSSSITGALTKCQTKFGWVSDQVSTTSTGEGVQVDIPTELIGPGTHNLFVIGLSTPANDKPGQAGCTGQFYNDGSWASAGCPYEMSEPVQFTVTVPFPPAQGTVLPGADVPAGTVFHPTLFSKLTAAPLAKNAGVDDDTVTRAGLTMALALVLAVLIALPTELLESTITKNHARIGGAGRWLLSVLGRLPAGTETARGDTLGRSRARPRLAWAHKLFHGVSRWWSVPVLILGSIIGGFADPQFGVNWMSLRLLVTLFLGFLIVNLGGTFFAWLLTRRRTGAERPRLTARPAYLLLILMTVIFARTINIEPSLVFGTLLALDYGTRLTQARSAAVTIIGAAYSTVLGLAAWWAYTAIAGFGLSDVGNLRELNNQYTFTVYSAISAAQTAVGEFASVVCVQALSTVPIALLPMAFLSGAALWKWKKLAWTITYAVGLTAYSLVLVPLPMSWKEISQPLALWVGVFAAYALIATGIWTYFRFTTGNPSDISHETDSGPTPAHHTRSGSEATGNGGLEPLSTSASQLDKDKPALDATTTDHGTELTPAVTEVIPAPASRIEQLTEHGGKKPTDPRVETTALTVHGAPPSGGSVDPSRDGSSDPSETTATSPGESGGGALATKRL